MYLRRFHFAIIVLAYSVNIGHTNTKANTLKKLLYGRGVCWEQGVPSYTDILSNNLAT